MYEHSSSVPLSPSNPALFPNRFTDIALTSTKEYSLIEILIDYLIIGFVAFSRKMHIQNDNKCSNITGCTRFKLVGIKAGNFYL